MSRRIARLALPSFLALGVAFGATGCKKEGPVEGAAEAVQAIAAAAKKDPTTRLGESMSADAEYVVIVRNLKSIFTVYPKLRDRIGALTGNPTQLETELRNTTGIDLARPESVAEVGVDIDGGVAISKVGAHEVLAVIVTDPALFTTKVTAILQKQPFGLSAEVKTVKAGADDAKLFARSAEAAPEMALIVRDGVAWLVNIEGAADPVAAITTAIAKPAKPLASSPDFAASTKALANAQILLTPNTARLGEQLGAAPASASAAESLKSLWIGVELAEQSIGIRAHGPLTPRGIELSAAAMGSAAENPAFARVVSADTYAFLRLGVSFKDIFNSVRSLMPQAEKDNLNTMLQAASGELTVDVENQLLPAFGDGVFVELTKAKVLSLSQAMAAPMPVPGAVMDALGVVIAIPVRDRATIVKAIDAVTPKLEGVGNRFEENGNLVIKITEPSMERYSLVLTRDTLLFVPDDDRARYTEALGGTPRGTLDGIKSEGARAIVSDKLASGLYLQVRRIMEGPIGTLMGGGLPPGARIGLGQIDEVYLSGTVRDNAAVGELVFLFSATPPAAPAAPATPPAAPADPTPGGTSAPDPNKP